ncbi:MAG: DUF2961 domain-containing protein [Clostridia bacterium]|nr:DUF2961 domain-containing protein [Clostridia bacterium]
MELFDSKIKSSPRWASFENPAGERGAGGICNNGAKGSPSKVIRSGDDCLLMHAKGSGVVRRIWAALDKYTDTEVLENLYILMSWDGSDSPAVECPLAEFFGFGLSKMCSFDSELFSSPEGRSFVSFVPMPFYREAKIVLSNRSKRDILFFYDVEYTLEHLEKGSALYFHAIRRRESPNALGVPYTILPKLHGRGRYLGTSFGVITDTENYKNTWFGEGEVKFFLDGDNEFPTLCGTGTEDYIGDGWGQGVFVTWTEGCLIASNGEYSFYRWHTVDPICFQSDIEVTIDVMGNGTRETVSGFQKHGIPLLVTAVAGVCVYDPASPHIVGDGDPQDSVLFFRQDDYRSVAYFYLDRP